MDLIASDSIFIFPRTLLGTVSLYSVKICGKAFHKVYIAQHFGRHVILVM